MDPTTPTEPAPIDWVIPQGWTAKGTGHCRSCGAQVMWCETPMHRRAPVDVDGTSHFATCPQADRWRKPR